MITRFAPSPTGPLHLGHAYSAIIAHDLARKNGGKFIVRIEDLDFGRSKLEWETQIFDDLQWLGLSWDGPILHQSKRLPSYELALQKLNEKGLLYKCTCTRKDIQAALSAPQEGYDIGFDGMAYPGTCRERNLKVQADFAIRINMKKALQNIEKISLSENLYDGTSQRTFPKDYMLNTVGDVVLGRKDIGTSYHLAVVVDDAAQGITDVVRGEDLFNATPIHRILQELLGLPRPIYHHHSLIRDDNGKRLAKRDDARSIKTYRDNGVSPQEIRNMVGL